MPRRRKPSVSKYAIAKKGLKKPSPPPRPTAAQLAIEKPEYPREEFGKDISKGLASAALAIPTSSKAGRLIKGVLGGAAIGADIGSTIMKSRRKRGKAAKTTVSDSASAQKARFQAKDPSKTKRV